MQRQDKTFFGNVLQKSSFYKLKNGFKNKKNLLQKRMEGSDQIISSDDNHQIEMVKIYIYILYLFLFAFYLVNSFF